MAIFSIYIILGTSFTKIDLEKNLTVNHIHRLQKGPIKSRSFQLSQESFPMKSSVSAESITPHSKCHQHRPRHSYTSVENICETNLNFSACQNEDSSIVSIHHTPDEQTLSGGCSYPASLVSNNPAWKYYQLPSPNPSPQPTSHHSYQTTDFDSTQSFHRKSVQLLDFKTPLLTTEFEYNIPQSSSIYPASRRNSKTQKSKITCLTTDV